MIKKLFIFCVFFLAIAIDNSYPQNSTDSLKIASIEDLSRELGEADKHLNDLLSEIESRIVSDTLTQADLNVLINALLDLGTPKAYLLILKHNKRYIRRRDMSTSDLAYHLKTGKPIYSIRYVFGKWTRPEHFTRFREYLFDSDYLSKPIPEEDLEFIRWFLREYAYSNREEDVHGTRKENLRRIRELD